MFLEPLKNSCHVIRAYHDSHGSCLSVSLVSLASVLSMTLCSPALCVLCMRSLFMCSSQLLRVLFMCSPRALHVLSICSLGSLHVPCMYSPCVLHLFSMCSPRALHALSMSSACDCHTLPMCPPCVCACASNGFCMRRACVFSVSSSCEWLLSSTWDATGERLYVGTWHFLVLL